METPTFLYKPNFCAECGEKIERESWHFWTSRRFCDNCEPVYRLNRILPLAFITGVFFIGGMFFGQTGQKYQKPVAVVATQSAINAVGAEKPQAVAPKQLLSANQAAQNSAVNEAPAGNQQAAIAKQPAVSLPAPEVPAAVYICGARTQKGTPCSRRVKTQGSRCWQHLGKTSMLEKGN